MKIFTITALVSIAGFACARAEKPEFEPVAFSQATFARSQHLFEQMRDRWSSLGYSATKVHSVIRSRNDEIGEFGPNFFPVYSAVWQKDPNIIESVMMLDLTGAELSAANAAHDQAGFRTASYSGAFHAGEAHYSVIYLKERDQLLFRRYRRNNLSDFLSKVEEARNDGYSPIEVNGWNHDGGTRFSHVWVKDGKDFQVAVEKTSSQWEEIHSTQRDLGRSLRDFCVYHNGDDTIRYAGVWVDDPSSSNHWRDMDIELPNAQDLPLTEYDFGTMLEKRLDNYVFTDVTAFRDPANPGVARGSYLLHRLAPGNRLESNQNIDQSTEVLLQNEIGSIEKDVNGFSAHLGFYLQDLENGNYIAYNAHEPVYISSTRKLILGSLMHQLDDDPSADVTITPEMFRDHDSGSRFQKSDVGRTFDRDEMLYRMLRISDNTAADYVWNFIENETGSAQDSMMNLMHLTANTVNCGQFTSKAEQEVSFRSYHPQLIFNGSRSIQSIPPHLLSDFLNSDAGNISHIIDEPDDFQWIGTDSASENWLNDHSFALKTSVPYGAPHHFATLKQSLTPSAFGKFLWALGREKIIDDAGLARLFNNTSTTPTGAILELQKMGRSLSLNSVDTLNLFDDYRSKNGATFENRTWVGVAFDRGSSPNRILPKYSFVFLTENIKNYSATLSDSDVDTLIDIIATRLIYRGFTHLSNLPAPPPKTFAAWSLCQPAFQEGGSGIGTIDDFDGDGFSNLLEYFLGTDPTLPPQSDPRRHSYPKIVVNPDQTATFSYRVSPDLLPELETHFSHSIETTFDFKRWSTHRPQISHEGADTFEHTTDRAIANPKHFFRLRITPVDRVIPAQ